MRGVHTWLIRFQREGHAPFIHRQLYPTREIPSSIQNAYAAIAVSEGLSANNENMVEGTMSTYAAKLLAHDAIDQPYRITTVKDHLARTQALLIHLVLALCSSSISRQSKAEHYTEVLNRWRTELVEAAEQESRLAQLLPCSSELLSESDSLSREVYTDLHQAFIICESIRRTWLLCTVITGLYRGIRDGWNSAASSDILFTARGSLWDAPSSAAWANIVYTKDVLFVYGLDSGQLVKSGAPLEEVDEFALHLYKVLWGQNEVESWFFANKK
jgi:hypothetical protein